MRSIPAVVAFAAVGHASLELGVHKVRPGEPGLQRRATFLEPLSNNLTGGGYYADVTVGTPGQPQRMVVDTGSSDIWVVAHNADLCRSSRLQNYYRDTCGDTCRLGAELFVFLPEESR
jgi:hypothetical protein